jgi:hypothetical protein
MSHTDPGVDEVLINHNGLLKVLTRYFILLGEEVISTNGEPGEWMRTVILNQAMCTVIQFAQIIQVEQTCTVNGNYIQVQRILFDSLETDLVSFGDIILTMSVLRLNTVNTDVVLSHKRLKNVIIFDIYKLFLHRLVFRLDS